MVKIGRGETNHLYVDVDGTLLIWPTVAGSPRSGETPKVNEALVDCIKRWLKVSKGRLVIWSMGGPEHAELAATLCGFDTCICIAKPDLVIDDAAHKLFMPKFPGMLPEAFCASATW